jgi:tripartite-type tricarboxylate transporter receptor subunit TctC
MPRLAAAVAVLFAFSPCAFAQAPYPSRPVTTLVGFAPGGGTDITARIVAKKLPSFLGQNVVVENRAGAGGNIATDAVAKAQPDGYTLVLSTVGSLTVAPHMEPNLPYNPQRDLAPISMGVVFANVLVVHPSVAASTVAEYIKLANSRPGGMAYATSGIGGAGHLAGELMKLMGKANLVHVPYKGGGPAMSDLLGGQVPSMFASAPTVVPQAKAGKVRVIAVTSLQRSSFFPDAPTVAEAGYAGYDATNWYAYLAPGKTPREIISRLNRDIVATLNSPDVKEQMLAAGVEPKPSTPEELARTIERELQTWGRVVKEASIKPE